MFKLLEIELMRLTTLLLKFMMSWRPFKEDDYSKKENKSNSDTPKWWVYETKSDYIGKVTWFLEDGIKQMKKDLSI